MTETDKKFEEWAVVEIMGHKRFAGLVTEQAVGGTSFVRIDVPAIQLKPGEVLPPFTKLFGAASIYCISPCTEETARAFAATIRSESFARYEAPRLPAPAETHSSAELLQQPGDEIFCRDCGVEIPRGDLCMDCYEEYDDEDDDDREPSL